MKHPKISRLKLCTLNGVAVEEVSCVRLKAIENPVRATVKDRIGAKACSAKHAYHLRAQQQARIESALALLELDIDPAEAAIHINRSIQIESTLETALDWLKRFASEFHKREQLSNR